MNQLVDYLASFSSLPSVNVRDAVAEAALSLAEGAIPLANQLKEATITADRQLHQSSSTSLKNPKSKAFAEQKEEYSHVRISRTFTFDYLILRTIGSKLVERSH